MAFAGLSRMWGEATAYLDRTRRFGLADLLVIVGFIGIALAVISIGQEWTGTLRRTVEIDLSPAALPRYTLYSLSRGLLAYAFSLLFTLTYGYWAAKDRMAEKALVPLLDVLQSIPVLGFMPGLVLALVAIFPTSNVGLELAAVIMIFTGQAWNMTFSYYQSLKSLPLDQREAATAYRFGAWQRLKWVELPFSTMGLVWSSMMSMAGGWFFLMINEAFVLGDKDFRLPGLGSYMSVAVARGDRGAMLWAVLAMATMIVLVDQLLWRPIVVSAQKFRVEESASQGYQATSWFLTWLRRSGILRKARHLLARAPELTWKRAPSTRNRAVSLGWLGAALSRLALIALVAVLLFGAWQLVHILNRVSLRQWGTTFAATGLTLARVIAATLLGTLWALPAGLAIGLSPRLSRVLQPVVQVVASFPAPMLFPAVVAAMAALHVSLGFGSVVLMLLGTQWYILFNVVAGAMTIPADLREAARSYRIGGLQRFLVVYFPAVLPFLVTGWVTAAGGAWNASIVAEYVTFRGETLAAWGIGSQISQAAARADFPALAAGVTVLALVVVTFNRLVWKRLYRLASERFSLSK
jgi:NitT/TauT family transport system permease protein